MLRGINGSGGGVPTSGSGAAGYLAKWTAATTLGGSTTTGATASPFVDATGNVGIGTASPSYPLHVGAGNNAGIVTTGPAVYVSSNGATAFVVRDATNSIESFLYAGSSVVLAGSATSHPYWIRTANTTRIAITATGDVGIGTTSPTAALDLPASTTARASLRIQTGAAPTAPNNGDIWFDGTNIFMRVGGVTKTFTLV